MAAKKKNSKLRVSVDSLAAGVSKDETPEEKVIRLEKKKTELKEQTDQQYESAIGDCAACTQRCD